MSKAHKYKIIVDMYETKSESRREWEFESLVLGSLEGTSDELIIEQGKLKVRKRIGITEYNNYYLMQDPVEYVVELTATRNAVEGFEDTLFLFKGVNYVSIENLKGEIFLKYIIDSPFANGMATQSDLKSQIRLKTNEINLKVSKDQIISAINLSPEETKIQAERIKLEGITTINDGFKIDLLGNMTCKNATINGGLVVKDGLYACLVFSPDESLQVQGDLSAMAGLKRVGYYANPEIITQSPLAVGFPRMPLMIRYSIPADFEIVSAVALVEHQSINWKDVMFYSPITYKTFNNAKIKDIEVYVGQTAETSTSIDFHYSAGAGSPAMENYMTNKISNVWGNGITEYNFTNGYKTKWTEEIADYINLYKDGVLSFAPKVKYYLQLPNSHEHDPSEDGMKSTAYMNATLYIYGYLKMVDND